MSSTRTSSSSDTGKTSAQTQTASGTQKPRLWSSSEKDQATGRQILSGKCDYPGCQHEDDEKTTNVYMIKNTDYKFHNDCFDKWSTESRNSGIISQELMVQKLDEIKGNVKQESKK